MPQISDKRAAIEVRPSATSPANYFIPAKLSQGVRFSPDEPDYQASGFSSRATRSGRESRATSANTDLTADSGLARGWASSSQARGAHASGHLTCQKLASRVPEGLSNISE